MATSPIIAPQVDLDLEKTDTFVVATTTTTTSTTKRTKNAFDLPELRHRLSLFVTLKDAISCTLVSKAWRNDFMSAIWFKVDFDTQHQFAELSSDVIAKHGHLIRIIMNAKLLPQIAVLNHPSIHSLRELEIEVASSSAQFTVAYRIISQHRPFLEELSLFAAKVPSSKSQSSVHLVPLHSLISPQDSSQPALPKLKVLKFTNLRMTHEDLVSILQAAPRLTALRLPYTDVIEISNASSYQHTGVTLFSSQLKDIFRPDLTAPSLLAHFPGLTALRTWNYDSDTNIPPTRIKEILSRYCPLLTRFHLADNTGAIIPSFCTNVCDTVTEVIFRQRHTSEELVNAILQHQAHIVSVMAFTQRDVDYEKEQVAPVSDQPNQEEFCRYVQQIPRNCTKLDTLLYDFHEMEMDDIEKVEWVCKDLKHLQIRVKGLDTKDKILRTIALWRAGCWRRWQDKAQSNAEDPPAADADAAVKDVDEQDDPLDFSLEARVARHLLKFEKLWWVWLGYQTWTPI